MAQRSKSSERRAAFIDDALAALELRLEAGHRPMNVAAIRLERVGASGLSVNDVLQKYQIPAWQLPRGLGRSSIGK